MMVYGRKAQEQLVFSSCVAASSHAVVLIAVVVRTRMRVTAGSLLRSVLCPVRRLAGARALACA